jgi:YHS domain-containing protein
MRNMQIDPICGMQVDENNAQYKSEYKGNTYYFCAPGCKKAFDSDPERYQKSGPVSMGEKKPWWKFW